MTPEQPGKNKFETENIRLVKELPAELGYLIDELPPELSWSRDRTLEAMIARDWGNILRYLDKYERSARNYINENISTTNKYKAHLGLIIDNALMWLEANKIDSYAADIWNARNFARNMNLTDIAEILDPAWDEVEDIQLASEHWHAKKSTEEMVKEALELFAEDEALQEEIKARSRLEAGGFLSDMVNVLIVYGAEDPLKLVKELGWAEE
jgi:hypothetical protein